MHLTKYEKFDQILSDIKSNLEEIDDEFTRMESGDKLDFKIDKIKRLLNKISDYVEEALNHIILNK